MTNIGWRKLDEDDDTDIVHGIPRVIEVQSADECPFRFDSGTCAMTPVIDEISDIGKVIGYERCGFPKKCPLNIMTIVVYRKDYWPTAHEGG